jgi:NADH:ubiquinone reductase (H+-translocating)
MTTPEASRKHRVVIVGAGFGGLEATKALADAAVDITIVDRKNHHLFQPLLYQVATAALNPADIAYPIRRILRDQPNVRVLMGVVERLDVDHRRVVLADGEVLPYDTLILATGAGHSYFGNDAWEEHAPGLKSIEDAIEIRRRILMAFEAAERTDDPEEQRRLLTFVVVGGGPTGVELAGALTEIAFRTLRRDFRHIDPANARVILVEAVDRILTAYDPKLSEKARRQLERLGVEVRLGTMVKGVDEEGVDTDGGRIESRTVLWGAGVKASPLAGQLGVELDRAGRVPVEPDLTVTGHPEILVVGDLAAVDRDGDLVPGTAPAAMQGGRHAAAVISARLAGRSTPEFRFVDKGSLATIGRSSAVGEIGPLKLSGFVAWILWWAVHVWYLVGFRNRLRVMTSWAWAYLTFHRGSRLITSRWRPAAGE